MKSNSLYDKPIIGYINTMADLTFLNILWLFCSLPLITIGASTSALYAVTLKIARHEPYSIWGDFIKNLKLNFFRRTILWILIVSIGGFLIFDYNICILNPMPILNIASYLIIGCFVIYYFIAIYLFPIQAEYKGNILETLKASVSLAFKYFINTIVISIIPLLPIMICYFFPSLIKPVIGVLLVIGVAFLTFLQSNLLKLKL
ncbi:MAG: DUF624 domain-containing protein [Lachnospiraceae bacterium]